MPLATQLTIRLRNDVGVLARLCRDLSDVGVNLIGLAAHEVGAAGRGAVARRQSSAS